MDKQFASPAFSTDGLPSSVGFHYPSGRASARPTSACDALLPPHALAAGDDRAGGANLAKSQPSQVTTQAAPIVFVIDGDPFVRNALVSASRCLRWRAEAFETAEAFLARPDEAAPSCLVLELTSPDACGLEVQRQLACARPAMQVIFITDGADLRKAVLAMKAGAIELFPKPIESDALMAAVSAALELSRAVLHRAAEMERLHRLYATLSDREREVMTLVAMGLLNKQVGGELGIAEGTVKAHRGQVMRKLHARSIVDLVHMSNRLMLCPQSAE